MKRALSVVALAALTLVGAMLVAPWAVAPAAASPLSGACPTAKGVTVVVNFGSLGGGIQVRCASSATSSTSGYTAMNGVGFTTTGTYSDGDAFVCRINDKPSKSQDPCIRTPPATAYSTSPLDSAAQARCSAAREEEHIVSTARLGPRKSKT